MSGDGPAFSTWSMDSGPIPALRDLHSALASAGPVPAPGARVVIRDAEWVIRRVDRCPDGGYLFVCDGVSELVREREAIFLTTLESDIQVRDALRRQAGKELLDAAKELAAAELPPTTMEEVQREVDAVRAERRWRAAGA